jgi:hypothetical protein
MRRHAGGIGCGARGRERTLLRLVVAAGAPARSMATGAGPPAASFAIAANTPGTTDGNRKARPAL